MTTKEPKRGLPVAPDAGNAAIADGAPQKIRKRLAGGGRIII